MPAAVSRSDGILQNSASNHHGWTSVTGLTSSEVAIVVDHLSKTYGPVSAYRWGFDSGQLSNRCFVRFTRAMDAERAAQHRRVDVPELSRGAVAVELYYGQVTSATSCGQINASQRFALRRTYPGASHVGDVSFVKAAWWRFVLSDPFAFIPHAVVVLLVLLLWWNF